MESFSESYEDIREDFTIEKNRVYGKRGMAYIVWPVEDIQSLTQFSYEDQVFLITDPQLIRMIMTLHTFDWFDKVGYFNSVIYPYIKSKIEIFEFLSRYLHIRFLPRGAGFIIYNSQLVPVNFA